MKIAPTLRCADAFDAKCHPAMCECVVIRMRALLAVARAAKEPCYCDSAQLQHSAACPLARALARLERLNREKP